MRRPRWHAELNSLSAVLSAWHGEVPASPLPRDPAAVYRDLFPKMGSGDPSGSLKLWAKQENKSSWTRVPGYFSAHPVLTRGRDGRGDQTLWPIVAVDLRVTADSLEAMLRLVLCADEGHGIVDAWGWRFDSADPDLSDDSHPYGHVQSITTWEIGGAGFQAPGLLVPAATKEDHLLEVRKTTPETRPAVPLNCSGAAGLAVAAMLSVYGPRRTARMLKAVAASEREFYSLCGRAKVEFE